jgi:hypothetical protein
MTKVDEALIEKVYSPLTGWINTRFGVDQWRLSIECLNGTVALYLAGVAMTVARKGMNDGIFADLLGAVVWLAFMELVRRTAYRQAASSLGRQTARMSEALFRIILVGILPLSLYYVRGIDNFCHTLSLVFFISHLYFKACDTPPPQRRMQFAYSRG